VTWKEGTPRPPFDYTAVGCLLAGDTFLCMLALAVKLRAAHWQAAEKLKKAVRIVIASGAKQSRKSMESTSVWIATPGFALLAMTNAGFSVAC
jgi:hypothetical protein